MGGDAVVITNHPESPDASGEIEQTATRPSHAPPPVLSKPQIGSDQIVCTPEQGQVHFVGSEAGPCVVMPMRRGPEAAHKPCARSTEYCLFLFFGTCFHEKQAVMLSIDQFVLLLSWFLLIPPTAGLIDASPVLERHCGRNPPDTTQRFQPRRDAKVVRNSGCYPKGLRKRREGTDVGFPL
jgi:hypothetical protein